MKYFSYVLFSAFSFQLLASSFCSARSYPIEDLPTIKNADYFTYRNDPSYRSVYSMLRLGTYFERRDVGMGSHQGVDIVAPKGTPVHASHEGEVIFADYKGDRGNVVVIRHSRNGQSLHTTYAHLSSLDIELGQWVKEGEKIWEVGDTGNATGPHLHFQIETNQDGNHPFFPKGCQGTIDEIVNEGTCFAKVRASTIDPILFLETLVPTTNTENTLKTSIYIQPKDISFAGFLGGFMETNSIQTLTITKKENWWVFLSNPITLTGNAQFLSFTPESIQVLDTERKVFIQTTGATGLALVQVTYGTKVLAQLPLLINTPEGIALRKQNERLVAALRSLGLES